MSSIRVLIADQQRLFRQGLRLLCEVKGQLTVVGEAENGQEAVEAVRRLKPDVVLMDVPMPVLDGAKATTLIVESQPSVKVIILATCRRDLCPVCRRDCLFEAIKAGAQGCLLKTAGWEDLVDAVRAVHRGEAVIAPMLASRMFDEFRRLSQSPAESGNTERLTEGEIKVLILVAQGLENHAIARDLSLSEKTVTNRLSSIYRKLGVNNRTQAALYALRQGWATLERD